MFLVEYGILRIFIVLKRYFGDWSLKILQKQQSFLYHHLCCRDSKPSSSKIFSLDVPRIAPIMARAASY